MNEEDIVERIRSLHPDAVIDVAGEDCNFELYVISDDFAGQGLLQRQKSILALFKDELNNGTLHALSIKAKTQKELEGQNGLVQISL